MYFICIVKQINKWDSYFGQWYDGILMVIEEDLDCKMFILKMYILMYDILLPSLVFISRSDNLTNTH